MASALRETKLNYALFTPPEVVHAPPSSTLPTFTCNLLMEMKINLEIGGGGLRGEGMILI